MHLSLCVIQARGRWKELSGCEVNEVGVGTKVESSSQVVRGQRSRSGSCNCRWGKINATELGAACACGDSSQSLAQGVHTSPRWCCLNTYCSTWQSSHSSPLVQSSAKEAGGASSAISWRTSSTLCQRQRKYSSSWWIKSTLKDAAERDDFSVRDWKFRIVKFAFFPGAELSPLLVFPTCQREREGEISTFTGRGNLKALSVGGKKEEGEAASGLIGEGWLHLGAPPVPRSWLLLATKLAQSSENTNQWWAACPDHCAGCTEVQESVESFSTLNSNCSFTIWFRHTGCSINMHLFGRSIQILWVTCF